MQATNTQKRVLGPPNSTSPSTKTAPPSSATASVPTGESWHPLCTCRGATWCASTWPDSILVLMAREFSLSPKSSRSIRFRHKYHFRRPIPQRRPIKIPINRSNPKPAPRQQMLHLIPEKISKRPSKHQPFLFPSRIRDIKNHLHIIP